MKINQDGGHPGPPRTAPGAWTLLELLVVMAIIGILALLTVGGFTMQQRATERNAELQLQFLHAGLDQVAAERTLPEKEDRSGKVLYLVLSGDGVGPDGLACTADDTVSDGHPDRAGQSPYVSPSARHPVPVAVVAGQRVLMDPFGRPWRYRGEEGSQVPQAWSAGRDGMDGTADDIDH